MAGIDVGGGGHGRRSVNQELPLVPFIDFLLCLVMFLLVTAVWSQMARLNADAQVPGPPNPEKDIEVLIGQLVSINGARLSKRAGNIIEMDDLRELFAFAVRTNRRPRSSR